MPKIHLEGGGVQVENAEVRKWKYGNGQTEVRRKKCLLVSNVLLTHDCVC